MSAPVASPRFAQHRLVLRGLVRAIAAAVYALLLHALLVSWAGLGGWGGVVLEAALVAGAAFVLARVSDAPAWLAASVGAWTSLFETAVLVVLAGAELGGEVWWPAALRSLVVVAAGGAGALLARRRPLRA